MRVTSIGPKINRYQSKKNLNPSFSGKFPYNPEFDRKISYRFEEEIPGAKPVLTVVYNLFKNNELTHSLQISRGKIASYMTIEPTPKPSSTFDLNDLNGHDGP